MEQFTYSVNEGVYTLNMAGDGKFNRASLADANAVLDKIDADDSATCLILTGTDKSYSQGLDLEFLLALSVDEQLAFVEDCMNMVGRLMSLGIPVSAAVNGHAFGLGAMLVLAADYAVMRSDRGYFCLPEIDLGMSLIPSMNALVCHTLAPKIVRDLLYTGARINAEQMMTYGIVDAVAPLESLEAKALEIAQPMIGKPRKVLGTLKADARSPVLDAISGQQNR